MNPFTHEPRRHFTTLERAKFFARANVHCEKCTRKLRVGEDWDLDHRIPLSLGGSNDDDNIWVLCSWCHDGKTEGDLSAAAKSKRVYAKQVVPNRFRTGKQWNRWGRG